MNDKTKRMLYLLPTWMEMTQDETSVGAKFLDVVGVELDLLAKRIKEVENGTSLSMVDLSQVDIIYKAEVPEIAEDDSDFIVYGYINNVEVELEPATDLYSFYSASEYSDVYIYDGNTDTIYLRKKYTTLRVNNVAVYDLYLHHVWGALDEIGLLLGIQRLRGEKNLHYLTRLGRAVKNAKDGTLDSTRKTIANKLGIDDAYVQMNSLADPAFKNTLLDDNGEPTKKLMDYAEKVNVHLSQTWDTAVWDKSFWTSVEQSHLGFDYIPHIWTIPEKEDPDLFLSGVDGGSDLLVTKPDLIDENLEINYTVGLKGIEKETKTIYPTRRFRYRLYAVGDILDPSESPEEYKYTIVASPKIPIEFDVVAENALPTGFEQDLRLDFTGNAVNASSTGGMTQDDIDSSYIYNGQNEIATSIVDGNVVEHPPARFLRVRAMLTGDKTTTPQITSITLGYHSGATAKTIVIEDRNDVLVSGDTVRVGFTTNNTASGTDPITTGGIANNVEVVSGKLQLVTGQYENKIDTITEWQLSSDHTNINFRPEGIFLNI